jgi:putative ABC transport system permease protein
MKGDGMFDTWKQDVRLAFRSLRHNWFYTFVVVATLALGVSGTTTIFSVVDGVLLRPLPYANADRVVYVWRTEPARSVDKSGFSIPDLQDYREQNHAFVGMAACFDTSANVSFAEQPEQIATSRITANLIDLLGERPFLGRNFRPEEEKLGQHRVVILSYRLWQRRFGSDQNVVGKVVKINGNPNVVVGVMPPLFSFPDQATEMWGPLVLNPASPETRDSRWVHTIALLKPGETLAHAEADAKTIAQRLEQQYPEDKGASVRLVSLRSEMLGDIELPLKLLLIGIFLLLLIVCSNVAGMMLAKGVAREKELGVRIALGASRGRLVRYLMTESMLLALLGGLSGTLLALWFVALLKAADPGNIPRLQEIGINGRVLAFTLVISVLTSVLFGLTPALQATKPDLQEMLKSGRQTKGLSAAGRRLFHVLTITEVSLAIVLLIGAGLLVGSFLKLLQVDPGFQPDNVLTMQISLPGSKYPPDSDQAVAFFNQLRERVAALPGVQAAGTTQFMPLGSGEKTFVMLDSQGKLDMTTGEGRPYVAFLQISPDYFKTMRIPLLSGRSFTPQDTAQAPPVAIISQKTARLYFPNGVAVGKNVRLGSPENWGPWWNVVGVVPDVVYENLNQPPPMAVYIPHAQGKQAGQPFLQMMLAARTISSDPATLTTAIKEQVWALDKDQPVTKVETLSQIVRNSLSQRRLLMFLLGVFAAMALLLSALGMYGTLSYLVTQRRHEIGIRMALGAQRSDVLRLVIRQGMMLALIGIAVGLVIAYVSSRMISSLLWGVSPSDPVTFILISLAVAAVALLASYLPARKAVRVDPMTVLRNE